MKYRVFTDPLRRIRDMDVTVDSYIQRLENKMKIIHKDLQFSPGKAVERDADLKDRRIIRATSGAHDI